MNIASGVGVLCCMEVLFAETSLVSLLYSPTISHLKEVEESILR